MSGAKYIKPFLILIIFTAFAFLEGAQAQLHTWQVSITLHQAWSDSDDDAYGPDDLYWIARIDPISSGATAAGKREKNFFDYHVDQQNHITPQWTFSREITGDANTEVRIEQWLWDHDTTSDNDHFDIMPGPGKNVVVRFKPATSEIIVEDYWTDFDCATMITLPPGDSGDDYGHVQFSVGSSAVGAPDGDSDNDGLLDTWEICGLDEDGDGDIDIDLRAMGADPYRKDLFIEIDWLVDDDGAGLPDHSHEPWLPSLINAWHEFHNAPVTNPPRSDGTLTPPGIALHLDVGNLYAGYNIDFDDDGAPDLTVLSDGLYDVNADGKADIGNIGRLGSGTAGGGNRICRNMTPAPCVGAAQGELVNLTQANATTIKTNNYNPNRRQVFHYSIFGHTRAACDSTSGVSPWGTADFVVLLAQTYPPCNTGWGREAGFRPLGPSGLPIDGSIREHTGTFLHELGHDLGIGHGGGDGLNYKPNYLSIMNYFWQFGVLLDTDGNLFPDLLPGIDYDANGVDDGRRFMYSNQLLDPLDENALNEAAGINDGQALTNYFCPPPAAGGAFARAWGTFPGSPGRGPIDWNCDGDTMDNPVAFSINGDWNDLDGNRQWDPGEPLTMDILLGFNDYLQIQDNGLKNSLPSPGLTREEYDRIYKDVPRAVPLPDLNALRMQCRQIKSMTFDEEGFNRGAEIENQYQRLGIPVTIVKDNLRTPVIAGPIDRDNHPTQSLRHSLLIKPLTSAPVPLILEFDSPQRFVGLHLGRVTPGDPKDDYAILTAFDAAGNPLGQARREIPPYLDGITGFLGLAAFFPDELIAKVELSFEGGARYEPVHVDDIVICERAKDKAPAFRAPPKFGETPRLVKVRSEKVQWGDNVPAGEPGHFQIVRLPQSGVLIKWDRNQDKVPFTLKKNEGSQLVLEAPAKAGNLNFSHWRLDQTVMFADGQRTIQINVLKNSTVTAVYSIDLQ